MEQHKARAAAIVVAAAFATTCATASLTAPAEADRPHPTKVAHPASLGRSTEAAKPVVVPGRFTGLGFDTCTAPDQAAMDELRTQSPYWGVGVFIGGPELSACAQSQPALTRGWVRTQTSKGWHIFALWVGRQSACADHDFVTDISSRNSRATAQGVATADQAVARAKRLGMAKGSTLFLDVEAYDNTTSACNQPVLSYQSGWNTRLRQLGWKGGYYSAGSSGIASLDFIKTTQPDAYTLPQAVWISAADGKPSTEVTRYLHDSYYRHDRLHQYTVDVTKTYGDVTLTLDQDAIDIGGGSKPPPPGADCGGVRLSFVQYPLLHRGASGAPVKAAQCLLKQHGLYKPGLSTTFGAAAAKGTAKFQRSRGLRVTKSVNAATWTALLSAGPTPLAKRGSASDRVRFLQRAIAAAMGRRLDANGLFTAETATDVAAYQRRVGLDVALGIVGPATWKALQAGDL